MGWTTPATWVAGTVVTADDMNTYIRDQQRYLKGIGQVPTIESGLTIDNTDGDERLLLPLLSTAECSTVLNAEGEVAFDEQTHQMKAYDGTAVRAMISEADVDDTPVNGADTVPVSSNWAFDFINTLTTRGDLFRRGASVIERVALGSTNQYLKSNGTDAVWGAAPVSSRVNLETRDLAAASGDVAYTGYGFTPSGLIILAYTADGGSGGSIGASEPALTEYCLYRVTSTAVVGVGATIIYIDAGGTQSAVVKTYDADGFTLTWTKGATPTGTAYLIVFAFV